MQLERVYGILLDLESLKLKLAAIPTGAPLREQVGMKTTALNIETCLHIRIDIMDSQKDKVTLYISLVLRTN